MLPISTCPRCGAKVIMVLGATIVKDKQGCLVQRCPVCEKGE